MPKVRVVNVSGMPGNPVVRIIAPDRGEEPYIALCDCNKITGILQAVGPCSNCIVSRDMTATLESLVQKLKARGGI